MSGPGISINQRRFDIHNHTSARRMIMKLLESRAMDGMRGNKKERGWMESDEKD